MEVESHTTDRAALLASVLAAPADDAPRLVYADWLDEHGEGDRAEFIRVQVELARLESEPERVTGWPDGPSYDRYRKATIVPHLKLRERERALWGRCGRDLAESLHQAWGLPVTAAVNEAGGLSVWGGGKEAVGGAVVRRGFVGRVELTTAAFMGGPCGRCEGRGRVCQICLDADSRFHNNHGSDQCPDCKGEKVAPGLAAALFAAQPVEAVALADKEPARVEVLVRTPRDEGVCHSWFLDGTGSPFDGSRQRIPEGLHRLMGDTYRLDYPSPTDALDALSAACVRYGRHRAGLEPLPEDPRGTRPRHAR